MKGDRMKPYDPSMCMRCDTGREPDFGSFFCSTCTAELNGTRKAQISQPQPNNRVRPPTQANVLPKRG